MNINHITKKPYKNNNQTLLEDIRKREGYKSKSWLTFVQANGCGLKVKSGEHGTKLMYVTDEEVPVEGSNNSLRHQIKRFTVFNLEQTERIKK